MLARVKQSLQFRKVWGELGVWFLRSGDFNPKRITVNGQSIELRFPTGEEAAGLHELGLIHYDDCYGLRSIQAAPATMVDVGANVGLFSLIARHRFPKATIHAYEPSPHLRPIIEHNLGGQNVTVFSEAVSGQSGSVALSYREGSMFTTTTPGNDVPAVDLETVVARCGGDIDLLKLDCEGAEWDILTSPALALVKNITMEFHLWARPQSKVDDVCRLLARSGFAVTRTEKRAGAEWGILQATRLGR